MTKVIKKKTMTKVIKKKTDEEVLLNSLAGTEKKYIPAKLILSIGKYKMKLKISVQARLRPEGEIHLQIQPDGENPFKKRSYGLSTSEFVDMEKPFLKAFPVEARGE